MSNMIAEIKKTLITTENLDTVKTIIRVEFLLIRLDFAEIFKFLKLKKYVKNKYFPQNLYLIDIFKL